MYSQLQQPEIIYAERFSAYLKWRAIVLVYLVRRIMFIEVLEISALMALLVFPLFLPVKRKTMSIKLPKNHKDTSDARYAINERGYLEEIRHDKLSSQAQ